MLDVLVFLGRVLHALFMLVALVALAGAVGCGFYAAERRERP